MTKHRDPDALLSAYLADGMEVLRARVVDSVLDEIHRTRQRTVLGPWRTRSMFKTARVAAAVVAVVALGGAFVVIERGKPAISGPNPRPSADPRPTQPAAVSATPSTTGEVLSLELTWTKVDLAAGLGQVAWLGDRFGLVDGAGAISTSIDGATWHVMQPGDPDPGYAKLLKGNFVSWEDDVVGWWNPDELPGDYPGKPPVTARDVLRIVRPPAEPTETSPFKGRIQSIGIGPVGIVAQVNSDLDWDAWVATKLGKNWVSHFTSVKFEKGILDIGMDNGPGLHVVWADEGFELGDYQGAGFEWYSPDGEQWTAVPAVDPTTSDSGAAFPTGFGDVVGVSDGFIASATSHEACPDGCTLMWHSSDGLTWRKLGQAADSSPSPEWNLLPWMGGALLTDGAKGFEFWTSLGHSELPMATELPTPSEHPQATYGIGPLGLVSIMKDSKEILLTRDGVDWKIQAMPVEMAAYNGRQGRVATIAVGDRSVLFSSWLEVGDQEYVPSLWVGSIEP